MLNCDKFRLHIAIANQLHFILLLTHLKDEIMVLSFKNQLWSDLYNPQASNMSIL